MKRLPVAAAVLGAALFAAVAVRLTLFPSGTALPPALAAPPGKARGFNLVFVTLDTVRADYLSCYGSTQAKTPALDALAAGGVRVAQAATTAPMTLVAHASLLTGKYPPRHGVRNNGTFRLAPGETTLAERLRARGYRTAAFIATFVLDKRFGTDQGFEVYRGVDEERPTDAEPDGDYPELPGDVVTDEALAWLDGRARSGDAAPFFLWLHLFDAHAPHAPPEPFRSAFFPNLYAGEVAFVDFQVGRLVDRLRALGQLERTVIVVFGDHGEGLDQHGENTHSLLIYDSTVRIPLIFFSPAALPRGAVVDDRVVSIVDVAPTVLDLLGLPPEAPDGVSLLRAGSRADRAVYVESLVPRLQRGWSELRGLRRRADAFIEAPTPEYYDVAADPGELVNRFEVSKEGAKLREELAKLVASFPGEETIADTLLTPDAETLRKLTALGYVGGPAPATGPPPDPKDVIVYWSRTKERALAAWHEGRLEEAAGLMQAIVTEFPGDSDTSRKLSAVLEQAGRLDDALRTSLRAVELRPRNPDGWLDLARIQLLRGDLAGMKVSLDGASRLDPSHGMGLLLRAALAREEGRMAEAFALCRQARERDPARFTKASWNMEADLLRATGRTGEARDAYRRVLEIDPRDEDALKGLKRLAGR
jgi:arylsulfatase A-like enzyme/Flp pilus assembly protein TadD